MENMSQPCCLPANTNIRKHVVTDIDFLPRLKTDTLGMVHIGGTYRMGTNDPEQFPFDGESPVRQIRIDDFYIDTKTVTNREFKAFVGETGYITEAQRFGWSFVFYAFIPRQLESQVTELVSGAEWWRKVDGASWIHPEGLGSDIEERMEHPVVHVTWNDAQSYAKWVGKRLPTEAEWEFAARGGLEQKKYPWGDELTFVGKHMCNIWQGRFPSQNTKEDGYEATAPAISFEPNGYGLYNASGNVWEWCKDWFTNNHPVKNNRQENPKGPNTGIAKVMKGGSYLCHASYCNRYRVSARTFATPDTSTGHTGFRCARTY